MNKQILFLSLTSLIVGLFIWINGRKFLRKGKSAVATIISNRHVPRADIDDQDRYYPTIKFVTHKNESVTEELPFGTTIEQLIGTEISIVYNPDHPKEFFKRPRMLFVLLPGVLVVAGVIGIVVATLNMLNILTIILP